MNLIKVSVSKHVVIDTDLADNLQPVRANPAQVSQILMNLVTNASEAIGERDGVIRMTTKSVNISRESADPLPAGDYLQLQVSDTGCGMPLEVQTRVFDPFFTTRPAGHGLGLAVVLRTVQNLGGRVHVSSEPGRGATFEILLPFAPLGNEKGEEQVSPTESTLQASHATVLVVDDDDSLRKAVVRFLRWTGFEVLDAADGSTAIDLVRANMGKIDLLLLDCTLPGASVHDVIAEATRVRPEIRVILTSAYGPEVLTALSASRACCFIRKPFHLQHLVEMLQNVLDPGHKDSRIDPSMGEPPPIPKESMG